MAGPSKFTPPCGCCQCPNYLAVNLRCQSCGVIGSNAIAGTITVTNSGGTVLGTCTTTTGGCTFNFADAPGVLTIDASASGYTSGSTSVSFTSCNQAKSATLSLCKTSDTYSVIVCAASRAGLGCGCYLPGLTVNWSGDVSGSAATNASGTATATITRPGGIDCCDPISITVSVTAPAGSGLANASATIPWNWGLRCQGFTTGLTLDADANHFLWGCPYTLPRQLSYSDDYGACTLTWDGSAWRGSYTYTSSRRAATISCSGLEEP